MVIEHGTELKDAMFSGHRKDTTADVSGTYSIQRGIDFGEAVLMGDDLVELQLALLIQLDESRNINRRIRGASFTAG